MKNKMNMKYNFKWNPWWLTGFTQTDGSFGIHFSKRAKGLIPYGIRAVFTLTQSAIDYDMLIHIYNHLKVGSLYFNKRDNS